MQRLDLRCSPEQQRELELTAKKQEVAMDSRLQFLLEADLQKINEWVDTEVKDIRDVQAVLKLILQVITVATRREFVVKEKDDVLDPISRER